MFLLLEDFTLSYLLLIQMMTQILTVTKAFCYIHIPYIHIYACLICW